MKIVTLFGTRPEIIRLSRIIPALDRLCDQVVVHTGQNHDPALSDIFFSELKLRAPDLHFGIRADGFAEQASRILACTGEMLARVKPDRMLILGDTNSGLAVVVAARLGIPVYHMEAGNRCYDDRVPEEINRRVIDHCRAVLMPYTHRSKENLLREGIERHRVFVVGNPIFEVLQAESATVAGSDVLARLGLQPNGFFRVTLHRAENVDEPARLERLVRALSLVADTHALPLIASVHPRTADKLARFGVAPQSARIRLLPPLGFHDFVALERQARCVLSDSGTVQEECCIFRVPNVTLRDVTERPETIECGSNVLTGSDPDAVLRAVGAVLARPAAWEPPAEYLEAHVSETVVRILLGYCHRLLEQ